MNRAVERAECFAAMADHRLGESRPGFWRYFDRAGNEELVVRRHWGKRPTPNAQRPISNEEARANATGDYCFSFLRKLMSPLRSRRASLIVETSSVLAA